MQSKLLVPSTDHRVYMADEHIGVTITGVIPEGRNLVNRAKEEAKQYRNLYGVPIPVDVLAERMSLYVHYYTLSLMGRPIGATIIICGFDNLKGLSLYMVEPSGICYVKLYRHIMDVHMEKDVKQQRMKLKDLCYIKKQLMKHYQP